jgi:hypothetical protein
MTSAILPRRRSDERLRKLFKEYTTLDDDEIKKELQKEDSTEYENATNDWLKETPSMLAATNQDSLSSKYSDTEWQDAIDNWMTLENINRGIGPDREKTDQEELD